MTYRQLINKPHVHTIREEVRVNKLPSKTLNLENIVEPVRERTETRTQTFNAPANQVHHHSTVVPSINEHRVDVRFVKGEDMHQQHRGQDLAPIMKRRDRVHVHNAAANEVNNRTIIRPYHNIETTDVQINKADNQV